MESRASYHLPLQGIRSTSTSRSRFSLTAGAQSALVGRVSSMCTDGMRRVGRSVPPVDGAGWTHASSCEGRA